MVIAAAGTESNLEALAAVTLLLEEFPKLKIRFINVVDLLKLRHPSQDPRGLSDEEFDQYFTKTNRSYLLSTVMKHWSARFSLIVITII